MPIYEYQCRVCGHQLEVMQSLSDKPLTICPACQGETLNKLISAAGFQLKGSGWYLTDYSAKGKTPTTPDAPNATAKTEAAPTKSTDNTDTQKTTSKSKKEGEA